MNLNKYRSVLFLKVDVDEAQDIAARERSSSHANFCSLQIRYENGRDARSRREFVRQTGQPLDSNDLVKIGAVTVGSSLIKGKKYYSTFNTQFAKSETEYIRGLNLERLKLF